MLKEDLILIGVLSKSLMLLLWLSVWVMLNDGLDLVFRNFLFAQDRIHAMVKILKVQELFNDLPILYF